MNIANAALPERPGLRKKDRRPWALWLALAAIVAVGAALAWNVVLGAAETARSDASTSAESAAGAPRGKATLGYARTSAAKDSQPSATVNVNVPTTTVEVVTRPSVLRLTGVLVPDEKSEVASNASGIVQEMRVDRGSRVEQGDVLARLDATDAENDLAEGEAAAEELRVRLGLDQAKDDWSVEDQPEVQAAKAAVDLAIANFQRLTELRDQGAISHADYDQAEMEGRSARERYLQAVQQARQLYQSYQTALTRLRALRKAVDDTTVKAPFRGWVCEKFVAPGERISVGPGGGGKVALLLRIDPIRLSLTVPQQSAGMVKEGQKAVFQVDSYPGRTFTAATRYISPAVDNATRSLTVEATVGNPDYALRPGMFATADLELAGQAQDLFVPAAAVQREGDVARLFVARGGVAHEVVVSTGATVGKRTRILSGLEPADVIVLAPEKVRDGDRIQ
ncbi:MAG: efflux RND transporter periplasmic adaptor subunit [Candidatus Sumerlaeota bacterium]|nr:efflux RND transporter periplasmic adaptor subunit [Candidatus Sumerlaeota bacterium]